MEAILRLCFSLGIGLILGLERKLRRRQMGMGFLVLLAVSSCLIMLISVYTANSSGIAKGDPSIIAAAIICGIGFLCGGSIIHRGTNTRGLYSSVLACSAVAMGMSSGVGLYIPALFLLFVCVCILPIVEKAENKFFPSGRSFRLHVLFDSTDVDLNSVEEQIRRNGFVIIDSSFSKDFEKNLTKIGFTVKESVATDRNRILAHFASDSHIKEFSFGE